MGRKLLRVLDGPKAQRVVKGPRDTTGHKWVERRHGSHMSLKYQRAETILDGPLGANGLNSDRS